MIWTLSAGPASTSLEQPNGIVIDEIRDEVARPAVHIHAQTLVASTQEYWYRCSTVLEPQEAFAIYLRADHTWQETPFGRELSGGPNSQHNLHSRSCSRVTSKVQGSCWATGTRPRNHSDQLVDSHTRNVVQRMSKETKQNTNWPTLAGRGFSAHPVAHVARAASHRSVGSQDGSSPEMIAF